MRIVLTSVSLMTLVAVAGCGGNSPGNSTTALCGAITAQDTQPSPNWQGTVFTIVMENHSYKDIIGSADAPFINSLAKQNAVAAAYRDNNVHPSEPNYLELVAGQNFDVLDDQDPVAHHIAAKSHIADQLEMQGLSWRAYIESMDQPCGLVSLYPYAPKHNPFVYFDDINGWDGSRFQPSQRCNTHVVDYSQLDVDMAAGNLPRYVWITPNMINDMHDGTTKQGDDWLAREVPKILASPQFNNGGVLFLTWDEGSGVPQADDPPMIVISPHAKQGYVSQTPFNESSYLKTVQKILGLQPLPCDPVNNDSVQTMDELFDVQLDAVQGSATAGSDGGAANPATAR